MREALFIKQNKDRWEQMQYSPGTHPDETAGEFIQLVEDLGYSKTFYPYSKITNYLNAEAGKRYLNIYENQKISNGRVVRFFKYDLPLIIAKHHRTFLVCFGLFFLFVLIGFFSSQKDDTFVRQILGDDYIDKTEENIRSGNPFGVYESGNAFLSFMYIFINNVYVSLQEFAGGIFMGIPTIIGIPNTMSGLLQNSIMVGAFEQMFYKHGLMSDSLLTVMIHGTLELFTFVISAASGLILAKSWMFPGVHKRMVNFKQGAKEALIIAMSNFPMLFIAALFEGFVTRHAGMPVVLKLLIIVFSLFIIVGYFIIYPIKLKKRVLKIIQ